MTDERESKGAAWFRERLPPAGLLKDMLRGDPYARLLGLAKERAIVDASLVPIAKPDADAAAVHKALEDAASAARLISGAESPPPLTPAQEAALELFVLLVARPALLIREGRVSERPENWPELTQYELMLPDVIAGVGRIESAGGARHGTGFLVGERRILTNNHVICSLLNLRSQYWSHTPEDFARRCAGWAQQFSDVQTMPRFELRGEFGSGASSSAGIVGVLGHHPRFDLALLELEREPATAKRLTLARAEPSGFERRRLYAVGYPTGDHVSPLGSAVTPIALFERIFGTDNESLGRKRLSPGAMIGWDGELFMHDASTLPGSSGSCLVDFESNEVVGIHAWGSYLTRKNLAVPLFRLHEDPILIAARATARAQKDG